MVCLYLRSIVEVLSWGQRGGVVKGGLMITEVNFAISNQPQAPAGGLEKRGEPGGQKEAEVWRCLCAAPSSGRAAGCGFTHSARSPPSAGASDTVKWSGTIFRPCFALFLSTMGLREGS